MTDQDDAGQIGTDNPGLGTISQNETVSHFGNNSQSGTVSQDGKNPRVGQSGENVAGGKVNSEGKQSKPLTAKPGKGGELIYHYKVTRHIAGKYGINQHEMEAVLFLQVYLWIKGRENVGVSEETFTDWTGARGRWQARIEKGVRIAIEKGLIERFRFGRGHVIDLTTKGERIADAYNARFDEIEKGFDQMEKPGEEQRKFWREKKRVQNK